MGSSYLVSSVKEATRPKGLLGGSTTHTALNYITGDFYNEKLETGKGENEILQEAYKDSCGKESHKNQHEK